MHHGVSRAGRHHRWSGHCALPREGAPLVGRRDDEQARSPVIADVLVLAYKAEATRKDAGFYRCLLQLDLSASIRPRAAHPASADADVDRGRDARPGMTAGGDEDCQGAQVPRGNRRPGDQSARCPRSRPRGLSEIAGGDCPLVETVGRTKPSTEVEPVPVGDVDADVLCQSRRQEKFSATRRKKFEAAKDRLREALGREA